MQIFLFFALTIAILAVAFALQNSQPVEISFIAWKFDSSLALVLLMALGSGALISFLVSLPANVKARWLIRKQQKKMGELETGLAESRARLLETQEHVDMLEAKLSLVNSSGAAAGYPALQPPESGSDQAAAYSEPQV